MPGSIKMSILKIVGDMSSDLLIISDPDNLLLEEDLIGLLEERMLKIINYHDPIELRFLYETDYRLPKEKGVSLDFRLLIRLEDCDHKALPYDIVKEGKYTRLTLYSFFPRLDTQVVKELTPYHREILYKAFNGYSGPTLGSNATKEYVLKNVFKVDPGMIDTIPELFHHLIKRHYAQEIYPAGIDDHILDVFSRNDAYKNIPVRDLVTSRGEFFKYLQNEWEKYVSWLSEDSDSRLEAGSTVPFEHNDIRVYIDNLFVEGLLKPVEVTDDSSINGWARIGVFIDEKAREKERILRLFDNIKADFPPEGSSSSEWLRLAERWSEFLRTYYSLDEKLDGADINCIEDLHDSLEECFKNWMFEKYSSIFSLSYLPRPRTVFHILPYLASVQSKGAKIALLVIDGMAFDQWSIISEIISRRKDIEILQHPIFAWVPTITCISRQSIFSGRMPLSFPDSLYATGKEEKQWTSFWQNAGLQKSQIGFFSNQKLKDKNLGFLCDSGNYKVMACTVTTVDNMAHGAELDPDALYRDIAHWIKNGGFTDLITTLLLSDFSVFITSDHGNIYSTGIDKPDEGILPEIRGERVRIFGNEHLLDIVREKTDAIKWMNFGLPPDCHALIARGRTAFIKEGEKSIAHGGLSLEEVIVPFVELRRKT